MEPFLSPIDEEDEKRCKLPIWIVPTLLGGGGVLLSLSFFIYVKNDIKHAIDEIIQKSKSGTTKKQSTRLNAQEKRLKIAILTENGNINEIHQIFCKECEAHIDEGRAINCLKVNKNIFLVMKLGFSFLKYNHIYRVCWILKHL